MKKPRKPKTRNPIAKAVGKLKPKVKPSKKKDYGVPKDQPSTGNYSYNSQGIFGGSDY